MREREREKSVVVVVGVGVYIRKRIEKRMRTTHVDKTRPRSLINFDLHMVQQTL